MYGEEGLSSNPNKMINPKKKFEQIKSIKTCSQKLLMFTGQLAIGNWASKAH